MPRGLARTTRSAGRRAAGPANAPTKCATGSASVFGGKTGPQAIGVNGSGVLGGPAWPAPRSPAGYETYRRMRRDPTIALARALAVAPVVAGKWTVEADADVPDAVRGWIDKQFLTVREPLLETILKHGYVDFGHQGFELVWGLDADGRQYIVRFKPLLLDITEILIDDHGGLAGLRQKDVELSGMSAMLVSFGGEGSNLYGEPLLENVREAWNEWRKANEVAARYDRKIAGAYLLLHYPSFGQGIDQNGAKLDNVYLAQRILDKLEAASGVAIGDVPSELAPGQDPNQTAWRLEVQGSAGGQQQGFVDRLRYLDSLKVRGMLLPERAILEGQRGTLAESQSQSDLALLQAELVHHHLTREINRQAVDPVLEANWGPAYRGKVRLEAAPLSADNQGFLRQLVTQVLSDPKDFADLFRRADWPAIFDAVGLPQSKATVAGPNGQSGPSAILSGVAQLQREAWNGADAGEAQPEGCLAPDSRGAHNEGTLSLANFNPSQRRDKYGKWAKSPSPSDASGKRNARVRGEHLGQVRPPDGTETSDETGTAGASGALGETSVAEHVADRTKNALAQLPAPSKSGTGRNDPVTLNLRPETADSMGWEKWKAPETGGEVGRTWVDPRFQYQVVQKHGANTFRVRYTLDLDAKIKLDPEKTEKLHKKLELMYGHEQRHVENVITIVKRAKAEFEKLAGVEFDSAEEARKAGIRNLERVSKEVHEAILLDKGHRGKDPKSPRKGQGSRPIGTMPKEPDQAAEDVP